MVCVIQARPLTLTRRVGHVQRTVRHSGVRVRVRFATATTPTPLELQYWQLNRTSTWHTRSIRFINDSTPLCHLSRLNLWWEVV